MILAAHGLRLELPRGWSGRLFERSGAAGLQAGNYGLAFDDSSTFGDASTGRMTAGAAFVALVEYRPGGCLLPEQGLFAPRRLKLPLDPTSFSPHGLAHPRPGQAGCQQFLTIAVRPLCVYVVLAGDRADRRRALPAVNHVLRSLRVAPRDVKDSGS